MRARLTTAQVKMLLDGQIIKHMRRTFGLSHNAVEVREELQAWLDDEEKRKTTAVFLDLDKCVLVMEEE